MSVALKSLSGTTYTSRATATAAPATSSGCPTGSFQKYYASLPFSSSFIIGLSDRLVVQVTSNQPVRLAFGTAGLPASLTIGMK
jgi:hypothetical protein